MKTVVLDLRVRAATGAARSFQIKIIKGSSSVLFEWKMFVVLRGNSSSSFNRFVTKKD